MSALPKLSGREATNNPSIHQRHAFDLRLHLHAGRDAQVRHRALGDAGQQDGTAAQVESLSFTLVLGCG